MWIDVERYKLGNQKGYYLPQSCSVGNKRKLPKREKVRDIELHNAGYAVLTLYKEWQEAILGRPVAPDDFVMQWEIDLLQNYVCHTGKVSRKWKEIYAYINKCRKKAKKEELPYGRIHDGRHTYITLLLHGIEKDDKSIIAPAYLIMMIKAMGGILQDFGTRLFLPILQNVGGLLVRFDRLKRK